VRATDLYPPELTVGFQDALDAKKNMDQFAWHESTIASKSGENIPVRCSGKVLHEKEKAVGTVAFFQDMREIKHLEKELLKSERLAAIGQTVAGLAHGIKNILHGLKGGSYLVDLGIKKNETEKLKKGWDMIKRNIGRTSNLAMDLLSYSKEREPEEPELEACFPNEIAGDVCALLQDKAREHDITIIRQFDDAIGELVMDPHTIHEVLLNLLSNAVDACLFDDDMSKNWQVSLKTAQEQDNIIMFEVTDNGVGMDEEVLHNLFTSFFSTKGHRGTGLGLMVTRKLVDEHGGNIKVTSQRGKGTTFTVRLPYEN
jgi:signal transduction histidine kinase